MKIAFVVAGDENLGVEYLSNYLKRHQHSVELLYDPQIFDKAHINNQALAKIFDWKELNLNKLKIIKPDLIAFSCVTATYQWALSFAKIIKSELDIPIIFGGVHPTLVPELVIENKFIDMVCIGEGEEAILELANSLEKGEKRIDIKNIWFRNGNEIIKNDLRPLNENLDDYCLDKKIFLDILPNDYSKEINYMTSRGCPYRCTYCGNEQKAKVFQGKGKYLRQKSVGGVISELIDIKKECKPKYIVFVDDVLTMDRKWFREFSLLYKEKINIPFTCFSHCRIIDEELITMLKSANCRLIGFGLQTGSEETRRNILSRFETNEDIIKAAKLCHKFKIKFMVDHIFDLPFDDNNNLESLKLYNKIRPTMLNAFNLLYFPKAKIIDYGLQDNKITARDVQLINEGKSVVYETGSVTQKFKMNKKDNYRQYALLYQLMTLCPQKFFEKIIESKKIVKFIGVLPMSFVNFARVIVNIKSGHGFIPWRVIRNEFYWIFKTIKENSKLKKHIQNKNKTILIISPFVSPNVGGVETHIDDLSDYLDQNGYNTQILTYQPLTTKIKGLPNGKRGKGIRIRRYAWFGNNLFHKLANYPVLNFLYITPYLMFRSIIFMIFNHKKIYLINAHGLNAAFIGVALKFIFKKKVVFSTMAIYEFKKKSLFSKITSKIINKVDIILAQSKESKDEFIALGFPENKINVFVHWVNKDLFFPRSKEESKKKLNWEDKFTVIFVGRLIYLKGADLVIKVAEKMPDINFVVVGDDGPLLKEIKDASHSLNNFNFVGKVAYNNLSDYYNAADIFLYPARYKEDMARSINESLSCGTPVLVTNKGSEPYTVNEKIARIINLNVNEIADCIKELKTNQAQLREMQLSCEKFVDNLNEKCNNEIIQSYNNAIYGT